VRRPLTLRLRDGVERQSAALGHCGHAIQSLRNDRARQLPHPRATTGRRTDGATIRAGEVVITEKARDYIRAHGGTAFVRSHPHRCCTGALTLLDVTMTPAGDASDYELFDAGGVGVRFCGGTDGRPEQLTIDMRGVLTRRPVAFWDGCAYKP
jgi:hypothetical protein